MIPFGLDKSKSKDTAGSEVLQMERNGEPGRGGREMSEMNQKVLGFSQKQNFWKGHSRRYRFCLESETSLWVCRRFLICVRMYAYVLTSFICVSSSIKNMFSGSKSGLL